MDSEGFIRVLTGLSKRKGNITQKSATTAIEKEFPDFLDNQDTNKLRKFIKEGIVLVPKAELEETFKMIPIVYKKVYKNHATLDTMYTQDVRRPIAKKYGESSKEHVNSKKIVQITYDEKGALITKKGNARSAKHSEINEFSAKDVFKNILENWESESMGDRAVALALASGNRPIEIAHVANYEPINETWIKQIGIAKSKSRDNLEKPLIKLNTSDFIKAIKKLRKDLTDKYKNVLDTDGQLNGSISSIFNISAKKILGPSHSFSSTRKEYANLSYDIYGKKPNIYGEKVSRNLWIQKTLGHKENDFDVGANYSNYSVKNDGNVPIELEDIEARVDIIEDKIDNEAVVIKIPLETNKKINTSFKKIKEVYDKQTGKVTQTMLEKLCKGIAPRASVRLWYKENVKGI
jgi:hypothetical protein